MITVRADHGGGPRHIELLLRHLPENIKVFVVCPEEPPFYERFERLTQGQVFTIPHRRFDLRFALRLARYARKQGMEVIHAHGKGAGVYARFVSLFLAVPSVHTPHGVNEAGYRTPLRLLYRLYENISSRLIDHVVFVSAEECETARKAGLWQRIPHSIIVNGVDEVDERHRIRLYNAKRRELALADKQVVIVTISRFDHQKNMYEAFEVAKSLPMCLFIWIGDGEDFKELRQKTHTEKLDNLHFLGALDDPTPVLAAADIYFSSARWEGLPLAVLEAMALGLPVVASDVIGHREVVGDSGGGILYPLGDTARARECLERLAGDSGLRKRLGEKGRTVQRERYSAAKMTHTLYNVYRNLLLKHRQ